MAEKRGVEKHLAQQKLDERARSVLRLRQKVESEKEHVRPDPTRMVHEKLLRKMATSGVVQLFNVIGKFQKDRKLERDAHTICPPTDAKKSKGKGSIIGHSG